MAEIDAREIGYIREVVDLASVSIKTLPQVDEVFIYISTSEFYKHGSHEYPIWRSYLDCVLAGYFAESGIDGVNNFIKSTEGWKTPILDDRDHPLYPRSVTLSEREQILIDDSLQKNNVIPQMLFK